MAEFCLDCWNKIMETNDPKQKFILSRKPDFCEECRQWKPVIGILHKSSPFLFLCKRADNFSILCYTVKKNPGRYVQ